MNVIKSFLSIACTLIASGLFAQESDLNTITSQISENLMDVNTSKETFKQSIEVVSPTVIKYRQEEVAKDTDIRVFTFNLGDIDSYTVKNETSRDVVYVNFSIENKQDLIQTEENGEAGNYENELNLIAKDADNARKLVELIKSAIDPAKKYMAKRLSLNSYEDQVGWITSNVGLVELDDKSYKQEIKQGQYPGMFILEQTEVDDKGSEVHEYTFNFADIDPPTVNFDISGDELAINFETFRDLKIIRHFEDGQAQSFEDELKIFANSVEEARDLRQVIIWMIQEAKKIVDSDQAEYASSFDSFAGVDYFLEEVNYGDEKIKQEIEGDCISTITLETTDPKGTEVAKYDFNWMDLNKEIIAFDVRSKEMYIELPVLNKIDLIKEYEGDEFKGFDDEFDIYIPNVEVARRLERAMKAMVEYCRSEYVTPYEAEEKDAMTWLKENVSDIDKPDVNYKQVIEQIDEDNPYKLKFTKREVDDKGSEEEIFEFNLSDLNPQSVEFEISGDDLEIKVESNYGEKLIKYYKDGEIGNYEDEILMIFKDINVARGVKSAMKELIIKASE